MLRAEGVGHVFGVDDVSFTLHAGQTLAVFGPNGAGKTTLLKILAGLIQPRRGRASVAGGRRAVGWIGHQPQLYGLLTVRENLRFWGSLYDLPAAERDERARQLVAALGLEEHVDRPVRALSRGLVQRAAIARALIHGPRVLLLDEPFAGLDRTAAAAFARLLAGQEASARVTVLVTHDVDEGTALATDVAFMRGGRFVALAPRAGRGAAEIAAAYRSAIDGAAHA